MVRFVEAGKDIHTRAKNLSFFGFTGVCISVEYISSWCFLDDNDDVDDVDDFYVYSGSTIFFFLVWLVRWLVRWLVSWLPQIVLECCGLRLHRTHDYVVETYEKEK